MGLFSGGGIFGSARDALKDFDLGETAESVSDVAQKAKEVDQILSGGGSPTTPPIARPGGKLRDPDPDPEPESSPDPQPKTFSGIRQTTIILLGLAGAFIVTQS